MIKRLLLLLLITTIKTKACSQASMIDINTATPQQTLDVGGKR